ncbi:MAG: hypothetical protein PUA94_08405 [Bacteroidales bacterium]|nr:hypothetical protein [Bacteroidales bacterium]
MQGCSVEVCTGTIKSKPCRWHDDAIYQLILPDATDLLTQEMELPQNTVPYLDIFISPRP